MNFFVVIICQCMLSAERNDSQSEEINVVDESQAENRPVEKNFFGRPLCLLCLAGAQKTKAKDCKADTT